MARARTTKGSPNRPYARVGDPDLVERRRAQIVDAATRLVARQGFARTVVRDIAEEAGISVGLVYEYVRSKEDILFLIYEHWSAVWRDGLEKALAQSEDPLARLEDAVSFLVKSAEKHPDVTQLYYREGGHLSDQGRELARHAERQMVEQLVEPLDQAVTAGLLRPDTDTSVLAVSLILLSHGYVLKGHLLRKDHTPTAYVAAVVGTVIPGWANAAGRRAWERRRG
jgi:TetR/AcrR family transcriptional regulator, cholesterol catabolism regulator